MWQAVTCPTCHKVMNVPKSFIGHVIKCTHCAALMTLPSHPPPPAPPLPAPVLVPGPSPVFVPVPAPLPQPSPPVFQQDVGQMPINNDFSFDQTETNVGEGRQPSTYSRNERSTRSRLTEGDGETAGMIGVGLGIAAQVCYLIGHSQLGFVIWATLPLVIMGIIVGFLAKEKWKIAALTMNFASLIPILIVYVNLIRVYTYTPPKVEFTPQPEIKPPYKSPAVNPKPKMPNK
jgi:hypothetical protein